MVRVYCAGKIAKNDWRQWLFQFPAFHIEYDEDNHGAEVLEESNPTRGDMVYGGPYFLACDHGCFHGDSRHGVGAGANDEEHGGIYCGSIPLPRSEVLHRCERWIRESDVIFAWLDCLTAYGTLAEIGFARGIGKPIFIYLPTDNWVERDLWLTLEMGCVRYAWNGGGALEAFADFEENVIPDIIRERLRTMPYAEYLQTAHWQALREQKCQEAGGRCQLCNSPEFLNVHHRTYERRGAEVLSDLTVLCRDCHAKFHDKLPGGNGARR